MLGYTCERCISQSFVKTFVLEQVRGTGWKKEEEMDPIGSFEKCCETGGLDDIRRLKTVKEERGQDQCGLVDDGFTGRGYIYTLSSVFPWISFPSSE